MFNVVSSNFDIEQRKETAMPIAPSVVACMYT